jgi:hypothetical protein
MTDMQGSSQPTQVGKMKRKLKLDAIRVLFINLLNGELNSDTSEKLAEEDAMISGRKTCQEWANSWSTSTLPDASHHRR